jgi:hypothetical protein
LAPVLGLESSIQKWVIALVEVGLIATIPSVKHVTTKMEKTFLSNFISKPPNKRIITILLLILFKPKNTIPFLDGDDPIIHGDFINVLILYSHVECFDPSAKIHQRQTPLIMVTSPATGIQIIDIIDLGTFSPPFGFDVINL